MNKLIKQEEITENGAVYIVETYERGTVKYMKSTPSTEEPEPQPEPLDTDAALYELLNATEYNTCLLEMQMDT
jgi:hypothetical protein